MDTLTEVLSKLFTESRVEKVTQGRGYIMFNFSNGKRVRFEAYEDWVDVFLRIKVYREECDSYDV